MENFKNMSMCMNRKMHQVITIINMYVSNISICNFIKQTLLSKMGQLSIYTVVMTIELFQSHQ